jgi:hypothetical protein
MIGTALEPVGGDKFDDEASHPADDAAAQDATLPAHEDERPKDEKTAPPALPDVSAGVADDIFGDEFDDEPPKEAPDPPDVSGGAAADVFGDEASTDGAAAKEDVPAAAPAKEEAPPTLPDVVGSETADIFGDEFDGVLAKEEALPDVVGGELGTKADGDGEPGLPDVLGDALVDRADDPLADDFGDPGANAKEGEQPLEVPDGVTEDNDGGLGATEPGAAPPARTRQRMNSRPRVAMRQGPTLKLPARGSFPMAFPERRTPLRRSMSSQERFLMTTEAKKRMAVRLLLLVTVTLLVMMVRLLLSMMLPRTRKAARIPDRNTVWYVRYIKSLRTQNQWNEGSVVQTA